MIKIPVHIENRAAQVTVVAFSGLAPQNHVFEWLRTFENLPVNLIGIQDPANDWYTSLSMQISGIVGSAILSLNQDAKTLFVGASAGGFAALRFSASLHSDRVIAFSPQSCVGNRMLDMGDYRWPEFAANTHGNEWQCDLAPWALRNADIHYAGDDFWDVRHAMRIRNVRHVRHDTGGHNLVRHLKETGELQDIIAAEVATLVAKAAA